MSVQGSLNQIQNNTNQVQFEQGLKNRGKSELTREGFLRLLMAQMQYQDPTNPMDYSQMLGQQVQLEQVNQMQNLVNAQKFSQAGAMVGQTAQLIDAPWDFTNSMPGTPAWDMATNSPKTTTGVIQSVQFDRSNGKALVQINGKYYDAEQIQQLFAQPSTPASTQS